MKNIKASRRGKAAIAAALLSAAVTFWTASSAPEKVTTATVHEMIQAGKFSPAVKLSVDTLIIPWEGLVLSSHWDRYAKIWDICHGETRINGKPVKPGMRFTKEQCYDMLLVRVYNDYYQPLVKCIDDFDKKPVSLQAMLISGAYNFGPIGTTKKPGACLSTAAKLTRQGKYQEACIAMTVYVRSGGQFVQGLANRRGMGDPNRIGEAELCKSGL
ncbi:glycoside hydrolase [Mesorhizobium sp. M7A.F.Ca.CA.002.12.1.1]|nr:glycoside hydrolase [Mesorhizobium sp. M7A.F.Ca.CA.002.12.1.1]